MESTDSSCDERNLRCVDVMIEINDHAMCLVFRPRFYVSRMSSSICLISYRQNFPGNLKTESGIAVSLQRMRSQNVCVNVCTCTSGVQLVVSPAKEQWTRHSKTSIYDMTFITECGKTEGEN